MDLGIKPRRIGRILGKLDDLMLQVRAMDQEAQDLDPRDDQGIQLLDSVYLFLEDARNAAEELIDYLNQR
jgi:hypothetical protein